MRLYLRYSGPGTSIDFGEELPVLGSFGNPRGSNEGNTGFGHLNGRPSPKAAAEDAKKRELRPDQLIDHEWSELPYTMMRVTAARRPWDGNRVYWRDRTVQLGEIDLNLAKLPPHADRLGYTAIYSLDDLRREFTLHPEFEDDQLRWSAPGISAATLTTDELAERLLGKLVTLYTTGLSKPSPTSPASPGPSS